METIGQQLRAEREKKGLSIKEIEAAISIRALYINAIEEGNYAIVPGEVYLKGFIRNYANYLGLNGQEMVASYRQAQEPIVPEVAETSAEPATRTKTNDSEQANNKSAKLLIISLLVVCVAGSAWWLLGNHPPSKEPIETKQIQPLPSPTAPIATQSTTPVTPVQSKPVVIIAKYTEKCWTSVVADGKQIYEGTPNDGETITWEAQKSIAITVGNAGGIDITYNGQSVGKIGQKGEVVVKTYVPKQ